MEKEKALKVMDAIDVCVVPLSIAGGARFGLNTYDIYRKVVGTKFRLSEALVCGLICMPLGMYAANVYADYISKPIRKAIENRASKEEPEKKDDIPTVEKAKDIVKEKTEEFKKDLNALVADIAVEPEEDEKFSHYQSVIEIGKAARLSDCVKANGGTEEECKRANQYTIGVMAAKTKTEIRDLMKEFGIRELREKYQPELYSHEVSEKE